jgi:hypothetical protein
MQKKLAVNWIAGARNNNRVISQLLSCPWQRAFPSSGKAESRRGAVSKIKTGSRCGEIATGLIYKGPELVRRPQKATKVLNNACSAINMGANGL